MALYIITTLVVLFGLCKSINTAVNCFITLMECVEVNREIKHPSLLHSKCPTGNEVYELFSSHLLTTEIKGSIG